MTATTPNQKSGWSPRAILRDTNLVRFGALIALVIIFTSVAPQFFSLRNWLSTSQYGSELLIIGIAEVFVIVTGGIDLSVGSTLSLSAVTSALMIKALPGNLPLAILLGIVVAILTGVIVGLVNGIAITVLKVTPFITTLGTLGIGSGAAYLISGGNDIVNLPNDLTIIGNGIVFGAFYYDVIVALMIAIICAIVLRYTIFGRRTYSVGSNRKAAFSVGIKVNAHLIWVYILSGALAGVAGVLNLMQFGTGSPNAGDNQELNAIAVAVIGGCALTGGVGTILGAVIGTGIVASLVTGLVIADVQSYWQTVAVGAVIVVAVYLDNIRENRKGA